MKHHRAIGALILTAIFAGSSALLLGCGAQSSVQDASSDGSASAGSGGTTGQAGAPGGGGGASGSGMRGGANGEAMDGGAGADATLDGDAPTDPADSGIGGGAGAAGGAGGSSGAAGAAGSIGHGGGGDSSGTAGTRGSAGAGGGGGSSGANGAGATGTSKITIWLAGDSTMANGSTPCPVGWGKEFQSYFNANVKVVNGAAGGTTVRSWLYGVTSTLGSDGECTLSSSAPQARWTTIVDGMRPGDYLLIQFGINDTTSATCPKHVSINTFEQLLGMMAETAKSKGANPIFLTAVSSISCSGSMAQGTRGTFAAATKAAAMRYNVPMIDLEQLSVAYYTASGFCPSTDTSATFTGSGPVGSFFCDDHTHFEAAGAKRIGGLVAKAIKDQVLPLASYLLP